MEEVILPFEPFKILVEVYNPSENIYDDLRLKVNVDNMIQTSDNFSMQPFSSKTITINSLIDKVGSFEIVTEIDYNSDISGVKFYLLQQSIPNLDICFLNIDANIKAYFEAAISSIGLGETITLSDCSFYFDEIINFDIVISDRFDLIDSDNGYYEEWNLKDKMLKVPIFKTMNIKIWGATAAVLSELIDISN